LVPGDVFSLEDLTTVPCDAYLLRGDCLVDESALTGESLPASKWPIISDPENNRKISETTEANEDIFESKKSSILLLGSKILKSRFDEKTEYTAIVKSTGFATLKGRLYRTMIFPPPSTSKLYMDSLKFVAALFFISLFGVGYSIDVFINYGYAFGDILIRAFDLLAAVVPQTLPATLSIGIEFSLRRLKKKQIYCISPQKINIAGKIDLVCFDKTGTLTEEALSFFAVGVKQKDFNAICRTSSEIYLKSEQNFVSQIMASCHSIREIDGKFVGDPLDLEMMSICGWMYEENNSVLAENEAKNYLIGTCYPASNSPSHFRKIELIKRFDFSSERKLMSVVAKMNRELYVFVKGAPEVICKLCVPKSLPSTLDSDLDQYTRNGYRVLCLAWKKLQSRINPKKLKREKIESDLEFSGFVVFENKLKPQSSGLITELNEAQIKTVVLTGDNILTAIYASRECGIIERLNSVLYCSQTRSGKFLLIVSNSKSFALDEVLDQTFEFSICSKNFDESSAFSLDVICML
jgi:cation-transporting ATPase 13A2